MGDYIPSIVGTSDGENIIYTVVTKDYKGYMLFAFENGKMAKVPLEAYATKTNRKKLIGAYSDKSPVCAVMYIENDCDIVAMADNNKVLYLNTDKIPLKTTKSTQGVQVMKLTRKGAKLSSVIRAEESGINDLKHYGTKNIPAVGAFLRKDDSENRQLSIFDE